MNTNPSEEHNNSNSIKEKAGNALNKLNKIVNDYKELGLAMCAVGGAVLTCYWNLICELYYRGYSTGLGFDTQYIEKDSQGLLISTIVFLSGSLLLLPGGKIIITHYDENNNLKKSIKSLFKSLGIAILNILFIAGILILTKGVFFTETFIFPLVLFSLSVTAIIIYSLQVLGYLGSKAKQKIKPLWNKIFKRTPNNNSELPTQDSNNPSQHRKINRMMIIIVLIIAIAPVPISFLIGKNFALHKKDFEFIVENYSEEVGSSDSIGYNLILSQNADCYCLAAYTIKVTDGNTLIQIYPDCQTIIPKNDKTIFTVVRKKMILSSVKEGMPND